MRLRPEIETLRAGYEAFNQGELEAVFSHAAPDFELVTADRAVNAGTYHGVDAAREVLNDLLEPFEKVSAEPEEFLVQDDRIVVLVVMRFQPHGSTAMVENRIAHLWTVRDGEFVRMQAFPERAKALEAAGLIVETPDAKRPPH